MTVPAPVAVPPVQFWDAAKRHYADAQHLNAQGRLGSADHLAGFAAECAIKAILIGFLGSQVDPKGKPFSPVLKIPGQRQKSWDYQHGHLPQLWTQLAGVVQGQAGRGTVVGPKFIALISQPNPFAHWDVADRYADASSITVARVAGHLTAANDLCETYQLALLTGTGTLA
ncbi:hypothetical protein [Kitasatospora griseola]|uniref:hypothetical protein n=1 Tax=Kitasatospora griseola TaxID=2064 RepID=UPI00341B4385